MADTLRIKRRPAAGGSGAPSALRNAELAFNEASDVLYYGKGDSSGNATSIIPIAGSGAFQPLDADLTALAGATGTNTIYYRSGTDTWSPVTMGGNMTFAGGVLDSAGGGGTSVTVSPIAPTSPNPGDLWWDSTGGQLYVRYDDGTSSQWVITVNSVGASTGTFVLKSGDTMTGLLTLSGDPSSALQAATKQYADTKVAKAGDTMTGNLTINKAAPLITLDKTASGQSAYIQSNTNGVIRWQVVMGTATAESTGDVGSDFAVVRYSDAGAGIDAPLVITRSTGATTLAGNLTINKGTPAIILNKTASGQNCNIVGQTNGLNRWMIAHGDGVGETGADAGSNFQIFRFTDAAAFAGAPLFIKRSSGTVALGGFTNGNIDLDQGGVNMRHSSSMSGLVLRGMTAAASNYAISFLNSAAGSVGNITTSDTATTYGTSSDIRLKDNVRDYTEGRATLDQIKVIQFNWKQDGSRGVGVSAQQAQAAYPAAVSKSMNALDPWMVDYSKYVPLLIQALQDAHRRIDELERRIAS